MLPDIMTSSPEKAGPVILFGFFFFFIFDLLVREFSPSYDHDGRNHTDETSKNTPENGTSHNSPHKALFTHTILLNLTADALHNFVDGIAIGTSYATSKHGHVASLSILLHEIPHELGDFAILVNAGFSKRQAIIAQFGTALAAFFGTIVGLALPQDGVGGLALGFTAGGFLYLACVGILPDILEGVGGRWRVAQVLAFCAGIAFMWGVAVLEHGEGHDHGSHGHERHIEHTHHHGEF